MAKMTFKFGDLVKRNFVQFFEGIEPAVCVTTYYLITTKVTKLGWTEGLCVGREADREIDKKLLDSDIVGYLGYFNVIEDGFELVTDREVKFELAPKA